MLPRLPHFRLFLACLALATAAAAEPALADRPSVTFFSSLAEEPLARLEAASIKPRFARHGPFRVPAPGAVIDSPVLTLHDQPCTAADWSAVLAGLDAWRRLPNSTDFFLTTPNGRAFVFIRPPSARDGLLSGLVRPLEPALDGRPPSPLHALRIAHDGTSRLRIDIRPLPAARQHAGEPSPEPASESPPTLP